MPARNATFSPTRSAPHGPILCQNSSRMLSYDVRSVNDGLPTCVVPKMKRGRTRRCTSPLLRRDPCCVSFLHARTTPHPAPGRVARLAARNQLGQSVAVRPLHAGQTGVWVAHARRHVLRRRPGREGRGRSRHRPGRHRPGVPAVHVRVQRLLRAGRHGHVRAQLCGGARPRALSHAEVRLHQPGALPDVLPRSRRGRRGRGHHRRDHRDHRGAGPLFADARRGRHRRALAARVPARRQARCSGRAA